MKWANASRFDLSSFVLPTISACEDKASELKAVEAALGDFELDSEKIISAVMEKSVALTARELRSLPYCIFEPAFEKHNPKFYEHVIVRMGAKSSFWRRLFRAWVFHYCPGTSTGEMISWNLTAQMNYLLDSQVKLINSIGACEETLDERKLCSLLINDEDDDLAYDIGLRGGVGTTQLAIAVSNSLAKYLAERELSQEQISRFIELMTENKELHQSLKAAVMIGVMKGGDKFSPDSRISKTCRDLVEANYPDPSVDKNRWPAVPEALGGEKARDACIEIVRRWRVFQSINLFFKVIGETITDPEVKHHFPRRKEFWLSYFKENAVSEAWILLGKKANQHMKRLKSRGDSEIVNLNYASLEGGTYEQSVLLLKVGSLTVVEWSHSGACRIWQSNNNRAPKLYQNRYQREVLMADSEERLVHDSRGNWQSKLHRIIRDKGGVRRRV